MTAARRRIAAALIWVATRVDPPKTSNYGIIRIPDGALAELRRTIERHHKQQAAMHYYGR